MQQTIFFLTRTEQLHVVELMLRKWPLTIFHPVITALHPYQIKVDIDGVEKPDFFVWAIEQDLLNNCFELGMEALEMPPWMRNCLSVLKYRPKELSEGTPEDGA